MEGLFRAIGGAARAVRRVFGRAVAPGGAIPTGAPPLDAALGAGGLPRGRIVECRGGESSGKTTLALHVVANAQRAGGVAAFIDAEHALDPAYARRIGVDTDGLLVSQPDSGEEALAICELLARSGAVAVVVVDSVAALAPRAEVDCCIGGADAGREARLMSQAMRRLAAALAKTKTLCVFTSQARGGGGAPPAGGGATPAAGRSGPTRRAGCRSSASAPSGTGRAGWSAAARA